MRSPGPPSTYLSIIANTVSKRIVKTASVDEIKPLAFVCIAPCVSFCSLVGSLVPWRLSTEKAVWPIRESGRVRVRAY